MFIKRGEVGGGEDGVGGRKETCGREEARNKNIMNILIQYLHVQTSLRKGKREKGRGGVKERGRER